MTFKHGMFCMVQQVHQVLPFKIVGDLVAMPFAPASGWRPGNEAIIFRSAFCTMYRNGVYINAQGWIGIPQPETSECK